MTRFRTLALVALVATMVSAQNLQLHFDPRGYIEGGNLSRNLVTGTFEMLKSDKLGSTFLFVDFDFSLNENNIGLIYTELSRSFAIGKCPLQAHIEYNGGVLKGVGIPHAYLAGVAYECPVGAFFLKTYLVYKLNQFHAVSHDAQWTAVWEGTLLDGRVTIAGFFDIWSQNINREKNGGAKELVILAEPQFWYNVVRERFALGTEIELSNNFYGPTFKCYPTLGVKYQF